ncbi:hypothetical protein PV325_012847 [Microctonus aethiopoides]|uniref:Pentatricopeptide repeat-containing protein n=1 Tax=Microctonus aethiopoides TaxID=144406 RepID=A0AA39EX82_9HYME|nr:hypothetical protein PV325_012847 [Microctonus aethiopoides]KAK0158429.1 hypothetical protein PV328_009432 [Microctonus aethiopoides]
MFSVRCGVIKSGLINRNGIQKLLNNTQLCRNLSYLTINNSESNKLLQDILNNKWKQNITASFSTEQLIKPVDPDVFGDISGNEYEKMELDDDEKEAEDFVRNESSIPRRLKLSAGQYAKLISDHIAKGDLNSAIQVLELVKKNRDKPTTYMYNLLLRGYAVQGNLKKCYKLYNDMKKRALKQNAATYTSILNACANSSDKELAMEILNNVRQELLQKNIPPNETHYNVMIKAYGKHKYLLEAFQLVDEMVDKRMSTDETTFNSLLYASISNKLNGLKYALIVWHLMHQRRIKPSILTYNLLLRAIRDTRLGNLKVTDSFIKNTPYSQIRLMDGATSDLLAIPPVITNFTLNAVLALPAPVSTDENLTKYKSSLPASTVEANENETAIAKSSPESEIILNDIQRKNRLILFGGYTGFLERMHKDNITPDVKTLTLLMGIVPDSLSIENDIIHIARSKKIPLNIDFFNMLIKKRCLRHDEKNAKKVLDEIQREGLIPNIVTWGVLAIGCRTHDEAIGLIEGMEATGHPLNTIVATTLLSNACLINHFVFVLDIMQRMYKNRVKPTEVTYKILDQFQTKISNIVLMKVKSRHSKDPRYKELFSKFNLRYDSWQKQFGREKIMNTSKQN